MLAEGKIRWAFWPPGTPEEVVTAHLEADTGIWIMQDSDEDYNVSDSDEEETLIEERVDTADEELVYEDGDEDSDEDEDTDEDEDEEDFLPAGRSRFAVLQLVDDDDGDEDSDDEEKAGILI